MFIQSFLFLIGVSLASGVCTSPRVESTHYSTTDAFFHMSSTFIVEFSLKCADGTKPNQLYAAVDDLMMPVAIAEETGAFQLTWNQEHDLARSGKYAVHIYDEDAYASLRKAQRNQDTTKVESLAVIEFNHPGASKGPMFSSEMVVMCLSGALFYGAYSYKAQLMA